MKKAIKIIVLLLCGILLFQAMPVTAFASSEAPYQSVTDDKWGNAAPSPNGYLPTRSIGGAQLGCGSFSNAADLFYSAARHEVYVVDSGNQRIVVLSEEMKFLREIGMLIGEDGAEYRFGNPQGVFVKDDGTMYVADMGNQEVVVGTAGGTLLSVLPAPKSNLLPDDFNYLPSKIVVDDHDRAYILSQGVYQGLIYLEADGSFIKFFGPNEVEMTTRRQMQKIWKTILSDKAAATMQSFNPIEYGNVFMGADSYIYATAAGTENGAKMMTKLNPLGIDCLPFKWSTGGILFSDVTVDKNGIMTVLDSRYGQIVQFNENGIRLFSLGGIGDQVGLFKRAVSIIEVNDDLYVLDADKGTITEFTLTDFGTLVREAISLYDAGLYQQSIEPWKKVIRHNTNFLLAYTGLGKAYYQLRDYDTAMYYYKLANDRANYSDAFREASLLKMRDSFGYIVLGIVGLTALILGGGRLWNRVGFFLEKKKTKHDKKDREGGEQR